jgi:hypothetical protein
VGFAEKRIKEEEKGISVMFDDILRKRQKKKKKRIVQPQTVTTQIGCQTPPQMVSVINARSVNPGSVGKD